MEGALEIYVNRRRRVDIYRLGAPKTPPAAECERTFAFLLIRLLTVTAGRRAPAGAARLKAVKVATGRTVNVTVEIE
jgi:hypothetical protein